MPREIHLGFRPQPAQEAFCRSPIKYKLGGGQKGGGKSAALAGMSADLLVSYPGNVGFMGRRDLRDLERTTLKEFLGQMPKELVIQHNQQKMYVKVRTADPDHPSTLYYGELKDPDSQLSTNLGFFVIDEAFEVPYASFKTLGTNLRLMLPSGVHPPFHGLLASNPSPGWLMDLFPVTDEDRLLVAQGRYPYADRYAYFPFGAKDNAYNPEDYWEQMKIDYRDDPIGLQRFVYGVWDNHVEGLVYHLDRCHRWRGATGERLYDPRRPVELAIDPSGGAAPYAVLVIQQVGLYVNVVDEYYEARGSEETFHEWARVRPWYADIADGIADPAAASNIRRLQDWGYPVRALPKKKDQRAQINAVKAIMHPDEATGVPLLRIDEQYCPKLVWEMGLYSYERPRSTDPDRNIPERPQDKYNHAIQALEYWTFEKRPHPYLYGNARPNPVVDLPAYMGGSTVELFDNERLPFALR